MQNPIEVLDRFQQRHRPTAFVFGVIKKFGDDAGSVLTALITYYGFVGLFPLLLVFVTVLGLLSADSSFAHSLENSALAQFPVIGNQLKANVHALHAGSIIGLVIGLLLALYGSLGVSQAAQRAMAEVWNVPGVVRPGFFPRLVRSLTFLLVLAGNVLVTTGLTSLSTFGAHVGLFQNAPWGRRTTPFSLTLRDSRSCRSSMDPTARSPRSRAAPTRRSRSSPRPRSGKRSRCVRSPLLARSRCSSRLLRVTGSLPTLANQAKGPTEQKEEVLPKYLIAASYTSEGAKGVLAKGGTARRKAVEVATSSLGGRVDEFYFAFGETDALVLVDLPDNASAASLALAVSATGAGEIKTTVLLTPEELDAAAKKSTDYRPPGS